MDTIYVIFLSILGIIVAIGVGLELSNEIDEFVIYVLFWMLYIVTIATFVNIVLVANYYLTMKNKDGPPGLVGPDGDQGEKGKTGLCDPGCRDSICETQLTELILNKLKDASKTGDTSKIRFNNAYIKSKVVQMCRSDEFKQLAPYNGPINLINYLKEIWTIWFDLIYEAGGLTYFQNIGAESDFDWLTTNPFNELKKYDVFYWGMGKQYRPQVSDKCYPSSDGNTPNANTSGSIIRVSPTTLYDSLGNDDGSGSANKVSFWRARQFTYRGAVYYPVGDLAIGPTRKNDNISMARNIGAIKIQNPSVGPNRETIIVSGDVKGPIDYQLIWTNNGSVKKNAFWIWRPIAPVNYMSLGDIITFTRDPPLTGENAPIRCVSQDITVKIPANGNIFWSSYGSKSPTNALILGFKPNDASGGFVSSGVNTSASNCYNMFRGVVGLNASIPDSDENGGFYYLDSRKYDSTNIIGVDPGNPPTNIDSQRVGKGYIPIPKHDAKYSVLSYLNLKNNPVLTHQMTKTIFNAQLIPNAISNAYLIFIGNSDSDITKNKCLNYNEKNNNSAITIASCDELQSSQIFSIIFTGNKKNECKLQHYDSQLIINYQGGLFTLVKVTEQTNIEYQLFTMG